MTSQPTELTPSYFVFADFLGFSQMVCDADSSDDTTAVTTLLNKLIDAVNAGLRFFEEDEESFPLFVRDKHFKLFSDNIAISLPAGFEAQMDESSFGLVITTLSDYQLAVMKHGFFVRGGFSIGQVHMDKNIIFGAPVIEAVHLEKDIAKYPRIILSDNLVAIVQHHLTYYGNVRESPQQRNLLCDDSGDEMIVFVNYLGGAISGDWYEATLDVDTLMLHRNFIIENLERFEDNPSVRSKYEWLAGYHNYFCEWMSQANARNYSVELVVPGIAPLTTIRQICDALPPIRIEGLE